MTASPSRPPEPEPERIGAASADQDSTHPPNARPTGSRRFRVEQSTLYVVGCPIGNLEDLSVRGLTVLEDVDLIACEDTRRTRILLGHYGIDTPMISYHGHNEARMETTLLDRIQAGSSVALVTDGGTPAISDPGARLVRAVRRAGHNATPIPGPSALTALLSVAGAPVSGIRFVGFLSAKSGTRRNQLTKLLEAPEGLVLYESPHRVVRTMEMLAELAPDRHIVIGRELTKLHEEIIDAPIPVALTALSERSKVLGELVLFVCGRSVKF